MSIYSFFPSFPRSAWECVPRRSSGALLIYSFTQMSIYSFLAIQNHLGELGDCLALLLYQGLNCFVLFRIPGE